MKRRARLSHRYVTWVFKDGQWRGHTLANPRDFVDIDRVIVFEGEDKDIRFAADRFLRKRVILEQDGRKICFSGHPDEKPCSLRVIIHVLQGLARACKYRISKEVSFLCLA